MSTKPRNPRYFPRMKVRGASRKRQAPFQRHARAFDGLSDAAAIATARISHLGTAWAAAGFVTTEPPEEGTR